MSKEKQKYTRIDVNDLVPHSCLLNPEILITGHTLTMRLPPISRYRGTTLEEWKKKNEQPKDKDSTADKKNSTE